MNVIEVKTERKKVYEGEFVTLNMSHSVQMTRACAL